MLSNQFTQAVEEKRCFVIMPFGINGTPEYERNLGIYQDMIKPVVNKCGYKAIRADEMEHPGNITRDIIEHLYESDLVVADLSGKNANMYYELGVRHALHRYGTILISRTGEFLPFDIASYRAIFYSTELKGSELFRKELESRIKAFEGRQSEQTDNPVHDILGDRLSQFRKIQDIQNQIDTANRVKAETAKEKAELEKQIATLEKELTWQNQLGMTFVYIPSGAFMMGSPVDEPGRYGDEVLHEVTLTRGFYMQVTPVTQGQWKAVMVGNPSYFKDCGDDCPIENVSWNDAQEFIKKLNKREGVNKYCLPTEAEWEYAARAGSDTAYCFGDDEAMLYEYAWYDKNSGGRIHPVASKKPNFWGLYDMHGNVWEWCEDWYRDYPSGSVIDPKGPGIGDIRVRRGGGWYDVARLCRSGVRHSRTPDPRYVNLGFRLVSRS